MSTLTKILIVLVSLASIFVCAIVVTYVATADNYKEKYTGVKTDRDGLKAKVDDLTKQVNEKTDQKKQLEEKTNSELASLNIQTAELKNNLGNVEREKAALLQKVTSWATIAQDFRSTNEHQGQLLEKTLADLKAIQTEQIKRQKELNETTTTLIEKMAIIETLESETKRLVEEKSELQNRLAKAAEPLGQTPVAPIPVTQEKGVVKPASPVGKEIVLQGVVSGVDLKNSMAEVSIGTSDGVKAGMKFHVTRGSEFICDILVTDVDTEKAVGVLELVQQQPKVGDSITNNL